MNDLKAKIMLDFNNRILNADVIDDYLQKYPADADVWILQALEKINANNTKEAAELLENVEKKMPYDADVHYLLGVCYVSEVPIKAIKHLNCAYYLAGVLNKEYKFYTPEGFASAASEAEQELQKLVDEAEISQNKEQLAYWQSEIEYLQWCLNNMLLLFGDVMRNKEGVISREFYVDVQDKRRFGFFNPLEFYKFEKGKSLPNEELSLFYLTAEMLQEVFRGKEYAVNYKEKVLLPILTPGCDNEIYFHGENIDVITRQDEPDHFNYYRIEEKMNISAKNEMVIGKPIPLRMDEKKKKLVISLFVDGLSQRVIEEEGLENLMPNTYKFFEKGLMCKNMYATADWTLPSLASTITGLELPEHMMVHPHINRQVPENKNLFDYMSEAGFYTAMISGDWRCNPTYGYARGIDRYIAGNQWTQMQAEQVVSKVLGHISAFDETNQYIWTVIGDLHDVADEVDLKTAVQTKMSLKDRQIEEKTVTSVKQFYSPQKRNAYIETAKQIDVQLKGLYEYIENTYNEDEFVVTLFGDHGQTYLNRPEEHHLAKGHTNVGFMVRGGGVRGVSHEYMSLVSYPNILCKLAGVEEKLEQMQGSLPVTFGGEEKAEFVLVETIHPGDNYMAAIYSEEYAFYFTMHTIVDTDVRMEMGDYVFKLYDYAGNIVENDDIIEKYINYLFDHIKYLVRY